MARCPNHCAVRRELIKKGLSFQTENDTEVAAGFITAKLKDGGSLQQAMEACLNSLDGFYTFVIGTEAGFGVLRDPIACKPAVVAEPTGWSHSAPNTVRWSIYRGSLSPKCGSRRRPLFTAGNCINSHCRSRTKFSA